MQLMQQKKPRKGVKEEVEKYKAPLKKVPYKAKSKPAIKGSTGKAKIKWR
jgi:hypothetical protein